ncbi:TPA: signal peptidase I [Candidatus Saccharibacteria bacterium]|nr:signal peptidase I [Candidatus Saccharibacteria bacterium]|tara:strand:- start:669 stop:1268 length:600 start_codon:yes stop_codon:yes gene_type:complete
MEASYFTRHPFAKDVIQLIIFIVCVIIGTILINSFVFRSYNVVGPSMEETLYTGDRLIVNRLPVTWSNLRGEDYLPERGQIIVFKNPHYSRGIEDEYIVKRVIGLPGERVVLQNGVFTVYNDEHPEGFNPDDDNNGEPGTPTTGEVNTVVPSGSLFVAGDHRTGTYSYDSRNGLGTIPLYDVIGPVGIRIFPFTEMRFF